MYSFLAQNPDANPVAAILSVLGRPQNAGNFPQEAAAIRLARYQRQ
jgi:hypothetical protein